MIDYGILDELQLGDEYCVMYLQTATLNFIREIARDDLPDDVVRACNIFIEEVETIIEALEMRINDGQ